MKLLEVEGGKLGHDPIFAKRILRALFLQDDSKRAPFLQKNSEALCCYKYLANNQLRKNWTIFFASIGVTFRPIHICK